MNDGNPMNSQDEGSTCGAKLRNKAAFCRNRAILVNGRCRNHGGLTPKGIASPNYKHGRYSKHLPNHLRDKYNETLNDPELTSLRDDLALIDVQISEVLKYSYSEKSDTNLKTLRGKIKSCKTALLEFGTNDRRLRNAIELLDEVENAIKCQANASLNFSHLQPLLEQRRRTVESENRRLFNSNNCLTVEQAIAFVRLLADSVKRHVIDPGQRAAVCEDFAKALSR